MEATEAMQAVKDIINSLKDIQFNALAMSEINRAIRFMKEEKGEEIAEFKTITDDLETILKALRKFRANTIIEELEV
ncbi:hypothetical protein H6G64_35470 [Calothrix sp. FACHB-156]|nr:hypothetical protein [Calothrix sp. FACHB-156]